MSDTTEAAIQKLRREHPDVESIIRELERHVEDEDLPKVVRFSEIFFSKAPPGFLKERSVSGLARMSLEAFRFLQESRHERVDVEVTNPDLDSEGWYVPATVIRTNVSERPFVVDTIREFLHSEDLSIEIYIYPVLAVDRDEEGRILALRPSREGGDRRESIVHCEITRVSDPERLEYLRDEIQRRLEDVVKVTDDFGPMVDALNETVAVLAEAAGDIPERKEEVAEAQAFLRWLRDGGFVFLGYRGYDLVDREGKRCIQVEPDSGLGILRDGSRSSFKDPVPLDDLPDGLRALAEGGPILIISKTNASATVHRRARMDYIGVKKLDEEGRVVGERRFVGLFTSEGYSEKAERIPILRQKLGWILEDTGVQAGSHDYKEIHTIFNSLPKEELFLTSAAEIGADIRTVLTTFDTDEVRVTLRQDPLLRGVSVMVIMAKEKFSGRVRKKIDQALVRLLDGEVLNYHLALGEGDQARLHFYVATSPEHLDEVTSRELEDLIREMTRTWTDRMREGLERVRPPEEARRLARAYGEAMSAEYKAATETATAVKDILEIEAMRADGRTVSITLTNPRVEAAVAGGDRVTELILYLFDSRLVLSDFMPILENCGLRVIAVTPYEIRGGGVPEAILHSFVVQGADGEPLDIEKVGSLLADTVLAVRSREVTNDSLNALVLTAGLSWREVDVLRAYASYGFQLGAVPSRLSLPVALRKYPGIASLLFSLFQLRFDPEVGGTVEERHAEADRLWTEFQEALTGVTLLSDDRALRRLGNLIQSTLRTNFFRHGGRVPTRRSGGVPYISFKFDCSRLEGPGRIRLRYEVWVRSSRMEGIHLRGAKVARGGIRYSDRPDDFRTEVMGLVKTQMVKNAVIVPAGSKGGFVTLAAVAPEEEVDEIREQYKTLIRGLLDLTDNIVDGSSVPPDGMVCWDDPDPYLVVAADKGTAKFSDVANEVAAEYGFWLGDAFASGGSNGYDHKAVGITARGAWECVKRHFLEKGKDIQSDPFTVVGIGDMSGDVFGNGMLLSTQIRLLAAFDHRDIFIDPDPDPAISYGERKRLFEVGRSSWQDYDKSLLSPGGMVIPRGSKAVELTPEALETLGIQEEGPFDGEALVRHVLRTPAELLWNGGIGTYVKASHESHADVGDPPNDAVRVSASELRCKVVGEGGNLGFTQEGRIEYALAGGRLNTDAIDNSGGVDLSDREVNLKILLNLIMAEGRMEVEERNELLRDLTDPVAELVLEDSRFQSLAVSLDEIRALDAVDDLRDMIAGLEKVGFLDRAAEHLPTWETLTERLDDGLGFTRPELSVLLAYAKLHLTSQLLRSDLPDDPEGRQYLRDYFPREAVERAGEELLEQHRLRREIVASQITNTLVDVMGAAFVHRVVRGTGRTPAEVARAWLIASRLTGHRDIMEYLRDRESGMSPETAYRWIRGLGRVLGRTTRWLLTSGDGERSTTEVVEESLQGLSRLREAFPDIVTGEDRRLFESLVEELQDAGAEEGFARALITLRFLDQLLEILRVHRATGADPLDVARTFYRVGELFWIPWLRQAVFGAAGDDRWEQRAAQSLSDDLTRAHQRLVAAAIQIKEPDTPVDQGIQRLADENEVALRRFHDLLEEISQEEKVGMASVIVAARELSDLGDRLGAVPQR
jgi:glutamate dehydrogenase